MDLSLKGELLIKAFESCADKRADGMIYPYPDECRPPVWTIAWGSTYYENGQHVTQNDACINQERADELFMNILRANYIPGVNALIQGISINQNQFDALVSICYNCEVYNIQTSTLLRRIRANPNDPTIRDAFMMWDHDMQDGQLVESANLKYRRGKESDFYFEAV